MWRYLLVMGGTRGSPDQRVTYRRLFGSLADELELTASYLADLEGASAAIAKMAVTPDLDTRVMLWECAVVRYSRLFGPGVRPRVTLADSSDAATSKAVSVTLTDLPDDLAAVHQEILALRDKHIAHSINHMEVAIAVVALSDVSKGRDPEYVGAQTLSMRKVPFQNVAVEPFRRLIDEVRDTFRKHHGELCEEVNLQLTEVPLDDLYAQPPLSFLPKPIPTSKSRPQLRR